MRKINPIILSGVWDQGYALDFHTISSEYIGDDEHGRPQFNTVRSELGELVNRLKYRNEENVSEIINLMVPFLQTWGIVKVIGGIIPVPPSNPRVTQPVFAICNALGKRLNKPVILDVLKKVNSQQIKYLDTDSKKAAIANSMVLNRKAKWPTSLLLVDDLYQSGTTLTEATNILRSDPNIQKIYVLTMTKTRT